MFDALAPFGIVEKASIDEAYLDVTKQALELHNSADPLLQPPNTSGLQLTGDEMQIVDTHEGAKLLFRPSGLEAVGVAKGVEKS